MRRTKLFWALGAFMLLGLVLWRIISLSNSSPKHPKLLFERINSSLSTPAPIEKSTPKPTLPPTPIAKRGTHSLNTTNTTQLPQKRSQKSGHCTPKRPCLAIIVDDIHTKQQAMALKSLNLTLTPSIFPPYRLSPHTYRLTELFEHYMVHLPLESGSKKFNSQSGTLMLGSSKDEIRSFVQRLRMWFWRAKFINNHTGSRFTANKKAMKRLLGALQDNGFVFVDSLTTSKSVVKGLVGSYHMPYIKRDIFLDNIEKKGAIIKQLKGAIKLAKKQGYAIAIGHPHPATLKALGAKESWYQKVVELVDIETIYKRMKR